MCFFFYSYWRQILTNWKAKEGRKHKTLIKSTFPALLNKLKKKLNDKNAESSNLVAGFDKSGLYPVNPNRPKSRLPQMASHCSELVESTTTSVISQMLQDLRVPSEAPATIRRKKKCNVPPGKSITAADLVIQRPEKTTKLGKRKRTSKTVTKKTKNRRSSVTVSFADVNYDSDRTVVMSEPVFLPSSAEPIAGPSGMCKNKYCVEDSDSLDGVATVAVKNKKANVPKSYVGKGKGVGKKSKPRNEHSDIIESLFSDTTVARYLKKKATKRKDFSTSESDTELMSIHTDSDINECVTDHDTSLDSLYYGENLQSASNYQKCENNLSAKDASIDTMIDDATDKTSDNEITQGSLLYNAIDVTDKTDTTTTNNTENLENDQNLINLHGDKEVRDEERHEDCLGPTYCVNDYVVVRYYNRKKWTYYVGMIQTIRLIENKYTYTVNFLKTVKKPRLEFRKMRIVDRDEVQDLNILKKIELNLTKNTNVLLLMDDDDKIYF